MKTLLSSYKRHLSNYFIKTLSLLNVDSVPVIERLWTLSCWIFFPSNWAAHALLCDFLPRAFITPLLEHGVTFPSASTNLAKIHNNFISRF